MYILFSVQYYQRLNIRVSLVSFAVWSTRDSIPVSSSAKETMQDFIAFAKQYKASHDFDVLHLLRYFKSVIKLGLNFKSRNFYEK